MRELFYQALTVMENGFRRLEEQVPPPQEKQWKSHFVFRHKEQMIEQALLQKLARCISGLYAVDILLLHGLLQEQAVIHRTLDEINEDILFLATAITNESVTDLHTRYLKAFYAEEFTDPDNPLARNAKPDTPSRKKIRAYVTRTLSNDPNPSRVSDVGETISSVYSGFVHASSPQIMDMYGGNPPKFYLAGMLDTPRMTEHIDDAWNYYYRGLLSITVVAKSFGDKSLVDTLYEYIAKFEKLSKTNYLTSTKSHLT